MKTIAVYDNTGHVIYTGSGDMYEPVGIPFLWLDIPEGKILISIDTTKAVHIPIYGDIPKTEVQVLTEQVAALNIALAEVLGV